MKKIGDVTSTADKNGEWTNGNVAAGIAPTILEAGWLNSVQREILGVLVEAGITQDKNNDNQLKDAIKKIISGGNYATKTEVNSKLAKDQNGADIPNKDTFIKNLGLPEKYQPKGSYQPAGDYPLTSLVFGIGQRWQDVESQRKLDIRYKNTTTKPIGVTVTVVSSGTSTLVAVRLYVDDVLVGATQSQSSTGGRNTYLSVSSVVPAGSEYYAVNPLSTAEGGLLYAWSEFR
ncbi:hypothetical protein Q4R42_17955 [Morganella morganii subsp. sibonii]